MEWLYQKDLGKKTDVLAQAMREYDCSPSWQKTDEQEEEQAAVEQKVK